MKIAVISDIHSNSIALKAVFKDMESVGNVTDVWCLGDILGCSPDPKECFNLLSTYGALALKGDVDKQIAINRFPPYVSGMAKEVLQWTSDVISQEQKNFIMSLPEKLASDDFTLCHASPRLPLSEGIVSNGCAESNLGYFDTRYCLVGHTHEAGMFVKIGNERCQYSRFEPGQIYELNGNRMIINPGSVGNPKDGDPRASYGIIDFNNMTWESRRVEYDMNQLLSQFQDIELPYEFYERISRGL